MRGFLAIVDRGETEGQWAEGLLGASSGLQAQPCSSSPFFSISPQRESPGPFLTRGGEVAGAPQRGPGVGPFSI